MLHAMHIPHWLVGVSGSVVSFILHVNGNVACNGKIRKRWLIGNLAIDGRKLTRFRGTMQELVVSTWKELCDRKRFFHSHDMSGRDDDNDIVVRSSKRLNV